MMFLLILFFGLALGSFFNVLIWRLPRGESVVWPSSHCGLCGTVIKPWHNIPVLSFLLLKGKCYACKKPISLIYPSIEVITGIAAMALWYLYVKKEMTFTWHDAPILLDALYLLLLLPITLIDLKHYIIPDELTLPFIALALLVALLPGGITPLTAILGSAAGGGSLYAIGWLGSVILKRGDAMGGGDIKLMAVIGALWGPEIALMSIVFGAFFGSFFGVLLMIRKKISADHHIPFGPFLSAGIWLAVLFGNQLLSAYLAFINTTLPF